MEAGSHEALQNRVSYRKDRHALMMGHVGVNNCDGLIGLQAGLCIIQCLIKPIGSLRSSRLQNPKIFRSQPCINHSGQGSGVRSDDQILRQPSFHS